MNQQQQAAYPSQRDYSQQYPQQQPEYYLPPRKTHTFISIGLILIVLFGAVGLYFVIQENRKIFCTDKAKLYLVKPKLQSAMNNKTSN